MALYITTACIGCGACRNICPVDAITGEQKAQHLIDEGRCIECSACGRVCPADAVTDIFGTVIQRLPRDQWEVPRIHASLCTACRVCVEVCPNGVLAMNEHAAEVRHVEKCISCGWCMDNCMFSAIEMVIRKQHEGAEGD